MAESSNKESEISREEQKESQEKWLMLSYAWIYQKTVLKIKDGLERYGHRIWIDKEKMGLNLLDSMANAVEKSEIALICLSKSYKESDNCKYEAGYIFQQKTPFIPLIVEKDYKADGWLGLLLEAKYYIDFGEMKDFELKLAELDKKIKQIRMRSPMEKNVAPRPQSITPTGNQTESEAKDKLVREMVDNYFAQNNIVIEGGNFSGAVLGNQEITIEHATIIQHIHEAPLDRGASTSGTAILQREQEKAQEDKDVQEFLHQMNESTRRKIKFDVRGNRGNLKEPKEYTRPRMTIIKLEGVKKTKDSGSKDDAGKKQTGTDVAEIKLEDLHVGLEENFHVLVTGDAGEGKTSTVKKYIELFLSDSKVQGKIKLVLYLRFLEIGTKETTAFDLLISKQAGNLAKRLKKVGEKWFKAHSDEVLIALDGMDQSKISFKESYPDIDQDESAEPAIVIANIASGHIHHGMKIVSTSRWHTIWDLGENFQPERIVGLRGFSHDQIKDLFKQVLGSKADDALKHLEENAPGLLSLCSTPNILLNTASVLSQSKDVLPGTETEIMVRLIIRILRSKNMQNKDEDLVANLSALAYYGLKNGIFMFSNTDLKNRNLKMARLQDFMKTDADLLFPDQSEVDETDKKCSYIHQTWQEVFAILHVCLNAKKFQSKLGDIVWKSEMEKFGVFLYGILAHKRTTEMVQRILNVQVPIDLMRTVLHEILVNKLDDGAIKGIRVCRVLQECDESFITEFANSVTGIGLFTTFEPRDSYIVSSAVSKLGNLEIVELQNLELNPSTVVPLANSIDSIEHFRVTWYIALSDELQEKHKPDVQKVLNKIKFDEITLNCTDEIASVSLVCCKEKIMSNIKTKHNKKLQDTTYKLIAAACPSDTLNISNNNLNKNHVQQLLIGAKESNTKLEDLCINKNKDIEPEGFRPLVDFAKEVHLNGLSMGDCNLTGESFRVMANQVEGKELELKYVGIDKNKNVEPEGYKHFVDFLKHTRVEYLFMRHCELTTAKMKAMTDQLKARDVKLKELHLNQEFPNPTKELLSCVCQLFHCVSVLIDLDGWKFSEDDLLVLKAELQKTPFTKLRVRVNHPSRRTLRQTVQTSLPEEASSTALGAEGSSATTGLPSQEMEEGATCSKDIPSDETDAGLGTSKAKDHASDQVEGSSTVSNLPSQESQETGGGRSALTSKSKGKSAIRGFFEKVTSNYIHPSTTSPTARMMKHCILCFLIFLAYLIFKKFFPSLYI